MAAIFAIDTSDYQFFIFSFIAVLLLHLFTKKYFQNLQSSPPHAPPSPPSLPLIGHLHLLTPVLVTSFQTLARRHGPLIQLRIGASTCVVASTAAVAKQIFKTREQNFLSRPEFGASEHFIYRGSRFVMAQYGAYWRYMKKITMTKLLSPPQLELFAGIRREEVAKLVERIETSSTGGKASDIGFESTTLTNNIICRMALSTRCSSGEDEAWEIKELISAINRLAGKLSVGDILGPLKALDFTGNCRKFVATLMKFDRLVEKIMKEHEEKAMNGGDERRDLLDILLEIYRDPAAEVKLTRKDIKSFLLDIFMAGSDTTATAVQWAMGELLNSPQAFQTLREEILSVVGDNTLVQESHLPNLPYLRAVMKETLRLHPSAPLIIRECSDDCMINGALVKAKTRVIVNAYAVMRDPESWSEPDKFMPERFLQGSSERIGEGMEMKGQNSRYIPFGSGKRGCPGSSLAMLVIPCAVAALVQRFQWKTKGGNDVVDLRPGPGFSAEMATPLVCHAASINGNS